MRAPIGPHIINGPIPHEEVLRRWQPSIITVLDPNPDEMDKLREWCPNTIVVGRAYVDDAEMSGRIAKDPIAAAEFAHRKVINMGIHSVHYWQIANEVHQDYAGLALMNEFELERMRLADSVGYHCAIMAFSVGNPDMPEHDRMALWRQVYPAMGYAVDHDHTLAIHQYGKPDLWGPDPEWFIHRYEIQVQPRLPDELKMLEVVCTEYGIDGLIWSPDGVARGWMHYTDAQGYAHQLASIGEHNKQYSDFMLGYSVFTLGHNPPWSTYDIAGEVSELLAVHYSTAQPPVTPPVTPPVVVPPPDAGDARISRGAEKLNLTWQDGSNFRLKDLFTTASGSWEPDSGPYSVPQWARDEYLKPWGDPEYFDDAGADHHLFIRVENSAGGILSRDVGWSTHDIKEHKNTGDKASGWQNMPMFGGSSFDPSAGGQGPWTWGVGDSMAHVKGGGLPHNHHVSTFAVFQEYEAGIPIEPPVEPPPIITPDKSLLVPVLNAHVTQKWMANPQNYAQFGLPGHNGLDYGGQTGDHIYAAADGEIAWVGEDENYGKYIRIWHPYLRVHTFYAHLSQVYVAMGEEVWAMREIGEMGSTGNSTGPHLHFEVRLAYADGYYAESTCAGMPRGRVDPGQWFETQDRLFGIDNDIGQGPRILAAVMEAREG